MNHSDLFHRQGFLLAWAFSTLLSASLSAEIFRDSFNRADIDLRASPRWAVADGAYYGFQTRGNRLVSIYAPIVGAGAINADRFVAATHRGEKYQRASLDIRFPQTAGDGYLPQFHLLLNWQGGSLFGECYRLTLRGTRDFSIARVDNQGAERLTSGNKRYEKEPLETNQWYRLTLERAGRTVSGSVATLDGTVLGSTSIVDDGAAFESGDVVLLARYEGGSVRSLELDNFEYELGNLESIQAASSDDHRILVDGRLAESCWLEAQPTAGFRQSIESELTANANTDSPTARVVFDDDNLYIGIRCPLADRESADSLRRLTPEQMFVGGTVQVFVDPLREYRRQAGLAKDPAAFFYNHAGAKIFRFAVNAANGRYSELMGVPWWKVPWGSATHIDQDYWSAELSIPFASLAFFEQEERSQLEPAWNSTWGINFAVDDQAWLPSLDLEGYPQSMGSVTGISTDPRRHRWALLTGIGRRLAGEVPLVFTVANTTGSNRAARVVATPLGKSRNDARSFVTDTPVDNKGWKFGSISIPLPMPGNHTVLMTIEDPESGKALVHRPLRIEGIQVGTGRWNRSFYLDEQEAVLSLSLGTAIQGRRHLRCDLRAAGEKKVLQSRRAEFNGKGSVVFDLVSLPRGKYEATITVGGYEEMPFTVPLRKLVPRRGAVQFTDRGILLRDGKPFFPFGMYYVEHHLKDAFLDEYVEAGFNTFLLEWGDAQAFVRQIDQVKTRGLVPIVSLHNTTELRSVTAGDSVYTKDNLIRKRLPIARDTIRMISRQAGDGILAWYTRDEPNELMHELVRGLHDTAHESDPYHPTITAIFQRHLFPAYHDATDILAPDIYPTFPTGRIAVVGEAMHKASGDTGGKPIFAVLQSFFPQGKYRMPNRTELRCMAYLSVVKGARGILWFSYDYNGVMADKHPKAWAAIKDLAGEFRQLAPALLDQSGSSAGTASHKFVQAAVFSHDGVRYLIAVNDRNEAAGSVQLSLPEMSGRTIEVMFEDRSMTADQGGTWSDDFGPYAVHIYRIDD